MGLGAFILRIISYLKFDLFFKDIKNGKFFEPLDDKQKWSYWPVRLYKAGKCMWLFGQDDYYQSLRKLAEHIKNEKHEKLDYFSHTINGKADVLEQWDKMEGRSF